jgi:hypothetical protein
MKEMIKKHWMWILLALIVIVIVYNKRDSLSSLFGVDNYSGGNADGPMPKKHRRPKNIRE